MIKPKLYLDTTVPSAYCDIRTPDRQKLTRQFWSERLSDFEAMISTIVLSEIRDTPDVEIRKKMEDLIRDLIVLESSEEADDLAQEYVKRGIFSEKQTPDANHVAIAVVNGIGYFASWNFKHLVKVNIRREINLINALIGYGSIEIVAPPEL
jgi:predicted nucleic acid-binding protein